MRSNLWADEDKALALKLWGEGVSMRQIAERFGRSRNAIIGLFDRLKAPPRAVKPPKGPPPAPPSPLPPKPASPPPPPPPPPEIPKPPPPVRSAVAAVRGPPPPIPAPDPALAVGLIAYVELEPHHCRWPYGDPRDFDNFRLCGRPLAAPGDRYCAGHRVRAAPPKQPQGQPKEKAS